MKKCVLICMILANQFSFGSQEITDEAVVVSIGKLLQSEQVACLIGAVKIVDGVPVVTEKPCCVARLRIKSSFNLDNQELGELVMSLTMREQNFLLETPKYALCLEWYL